MNSIIEAIDKEIERLTEARALLVTVPDVTSVVRKIKGKATGKPTTSKRGRPAGSKNKVAKPTTKKRVLSAEGKAKIAAAQKARWAARRAS